jgi:hypothetical protein
VLLVPGNYSWPRGGPPGARPFELALASQALSGLSAISPEREALSEVIVAKFYRLTLAAPAGLGWVASAKKRNSNFWRYGKTRV